VKSYLEGCGVPLTRIGDIEIPRLIMGIHPYDGCSYQDVATDDSNARAFSRAEQISEIISWTVREAGVTAVQVDHMNAALDRLHLQAVREAELKTQTSIGLVAYILIPIVLKGEVVAYSDRAHATFYDRNDRLAGAAFRQKIKDDEIVRYVLGGAAENLVTPDLIAPYTARDAENFQIDYGILERYLGFFEGCDVLIADPGAEIDLLAMTGRFDLIREYLGFLKSRFQTVITSVHHAGVTLPLLEEENIPVDGYLTTINQPGTFMFPTRDLALSAIKNTTKPVIAIKPMAGGRYLGNKAFEFVFNEAGAEAAMFGMGSLSQVRETATAARQVLGVA
jgi:hypothetical protein